MSTVSIKFIIGSTRPNRFGPKAAAWLSDIAKQYEEHATFEVVDVQDLGLPLLDEPLPPSMGKYAQDHTKKWAAMVAEADAFVFITPEYNHSMPAALKNAIDFVGREWSHKPAAFLGYGADAGGVRAIEHLRGVVSWLGMYDLHYFVALPNYYEHLDDTGNIIATDRQTEAAHRMLERLVFWAEKMKQARAELEASRA